MINNEKLVCQEDKNIHADQDDITENFIPHIALSEPL